MNISEGFIRRPIATSLLMAGIALFGVIAYRALPVSDLPQVDYPTISVSASLPGANPNTMASAVATPLERQLTSIAGLDSISPKQVQVFGATKYAVRVQVDPNELASRQIGLNEVDAALRNWNVNIPTGTLFGPHTSYNIKVNGQLMRAADYKPLIVTYRHGAPVRL